MRSITKLPSEPSERLHPRYARSHGSSLLLRVYARRVSPITRTPDIRRSALGRGIERQRGILRRLGIVSCVAALKVAVRQTKRTRRELNSALLFSGLPCVRSANPPHQITCGTQVANVRGAQPPRAEEYVHVGGTEAYKPLPRKSSLVYLLAPVVASSGAVMTSEPLRYAVIRGTFVGFSLVDCRLSIVDCRLIRNTRSRTAFWTDKRAIASPPGRSDRGTP